MKKIKKIQLIENPREEIKLADNDMSSLLGGYYCPGTYKSGGLFGDDYCSKNFNEDASCNGANDYCGQLSSCTFIYTY